MEVLFPVISSPLTKPRFRGTVFLCVLRAPWREFQRQFSFVNCPMFFCPYYWKVSTAAARWTQLITGMTRSFCLLPNIHTSFTLPNKLLSFHSLVNQQCGVSGTRVLLHILPKSVASVGRRWPLLSEGVERLSESRQHVGYTTFPQRCPCDRVFWTRYSLDWLCICSHWANHMFRVCACVFSFGF